MELLSRLHSKLGRWGWGCSGGPRILEMPEPWDVHWKNGWNWLRPVHERWHTGKQPRKSGIPKSIRAQLMPPRVPDAGHEANGFAVCPAGFCFCFSQSFPDMAPFFPFEIRMVTMWYIWRMWLSSIGYTRGSQVNDFLEFYKRLWAFGQYGDYWDLGSS